MKPTLLQLFITVLKMRFGENSQWSVQCNTYPASPPCYVYSLKHKGFENSITLLCVDSTDNKEYNSLEVIHIFDKGIKQYVTSIDSWIASLCEAISNAEDIIDESNDKIKLLNSIKNEHPL